MLKLVFGLGPSELLVILIIVILIYGGKRIPEIGHGLGKSIREFKKAKNQYENQHDVVEKWLNESPVSETKKVSSANGTDKANGSGKSSSEEVKEKINRIR